MAPGLHYECTRVPVTAIASCAGLLLAAEGPFLRFYDAEKSQFLASERIFKAQAIHGITVCADRHNAATTLVIWGGRLVRAVAIQDNQSNKPSDNPRVRLSNIVKASDWILDLAAQPTTSDGKAEHLGDICAAVTAHNALIHIEITCWAVDVASESCYEPNRLRANDQTNVPTSAHGNFTLTTTELTPSSRSILYAAHLLWESATRVLVAAGTAFGEVIYWSWTREPRKDAVIQTHRIFLGHEGSVFGVQISKELRLERYPGLERVVASCSDDRTIRIWDVSNSGAPNNIKHAQEDHAEVLRTRHTGFSNENFDDTSYNGSGCLAVGWGHVSRVWTVRFLDSSRHDEPLLLISTGEDASARTWELTIDARTDILSPYRLTQLYRSGNHSGKNLWSSDIFSDQGGSFRAVSGGADSKITASPIFQTTLWAKYGTDIAFAEYSVQDILSLSKSGNVDSGSIIMPKDLQTKTEFFRSYCFIDTKKVLLITNTGKLLLGSLQFTDGPRTSACFNNIACVAQLDELCSYSICVGGAAPGIAVVASATGNVHVFHDRTNTLLKVHSMQSKIGSLHVSALQSSTDENLEIALLIFPIGREQPHLLFVDIGVDVNIASVVILPIPETCNGSSVTSMCCVNAGDVEYISIGFRHGTIAIYAIERFETQRQAALFEAIEHAHSNETVTCLQWQILVKNPFLANLVSVGRDGRLSVHQTDAGKNLVELVHRVSLPIVSNIEGLFVSQDSLLAHGFSGKNWILYDVKAEEEIMSVDTGGAHRSWDCQLDSSATGGTLLWTRASSLHVCHYNAPNHSVIRPGGHGREIKAVAFSSMTETNQSRTGLIATGAEDTDIKLFQYMNDDLICRHTLRKHTTGIQHLQWSHDGKYLFSSGGCEEFYVWRIRSVPPLLCLGAVCEHTYAPESEHSDLRIMSFDVVTRSNAYIIAMVFSDSSIKVYCFDPAAANNWHVMAKGIYFTSCLTQCILLPGEKALTIGTDGHAVTWSLDTAFLRAGSEGYKILSWRDPTMVHQSSSKTTAVLRMDDTRVLIVSGGDDGSLALLVTMGDQLKTGTATAQPREFLPILLRKAHASAVTACVIVQFSWGIYIITAGNDEWIRVWKVELGERSRGHADDADAGLNDCATMQRCGRIKTNVADVSSMVVIGVNDCVARILICGVGMEVIRLDNRSATFA